MLGNPIPGLTCHFPDVPGSHNPTGREAWTSGVWRESIRELRKLGKRGNDGERWRHIQRHTDGGRGRWMDPRQPRG